MLLALASVLAAAPPPQFESTVDMIRLDAVVARDGAPVAGLTADDFEVIDDGQRRKVAIASRGEERVHAVLVLDLSSSLSQADRQHLADAARSFLRQLGPADRATVLTFTEDLQLVSGPGTPASAASSLSKLGGAGATALYDAIFGGLTLAGTAEGRPFVVVFTDGEDELSWVRGDDVLAAARGFDASVYFVMTAPRVRVLAANPFSDDAPRALERPISPMLAPIAEETGGRLFRGRALRDIERDFTAVLAEVKNRYLLTYPASDGARLGWHKVTVRLKKAKGDVRTRRGYFVGPPSGEGSRPPSP
jgi:Ca-activated chloride channel family protein